MISISDIQNGTGGFVVNGVPTDNGQGVSVSNAGDLNGDGRDDFIIGARTADPNGAAPGGAYAGEAYVVFGKTDTAAVEIADIRSGIGGFKIQGAGVGHQAGWSVSEAGDVNNDGTPDLIVGARNAAPNGTDSGSAYVVYGKSDGTAVDLSDVGAGTGGFVINGAVAGDLAGYSVSDAGDVNGDGYGDVIVGAILADAGEYMPGYPNFDSGASYVVFGKADGTAVELSDVASGTGGFAINGASYGDYSGRSVSSLGDVNGDGLDDLLVGASHDDPNGVNSGQAFVVYGKADGTAVELSDVETGTGGFAIVGASVGGLAGYSVSGAGDVNGDGIGDLIVGAPGAGAAYVVFGKTDDSPVDLGDIEAGTGGGFAITAGGQLGYSVSVAGDVNGDGLADVVVGASGLRTFVVYGKGSSTAVDGADLSVDLGGYAISGLPDVGYSVSGGGDINGDGLDDVVLAAVGDELDGPAQGGAVVVFGEATENRPVDIEEIAEDYDPGGFAMTGATWGGLLGWSVSDAGDVNGDGFADMIVGAPTFSTSWAGTAYVVFGKSDGIAVDLSDVAAGNGGFAINGASGSGTLGVSVSGAGDVNGDGVSDLLVGDPWANTGDGTAYVVFGKSDGTAVDLSDVTAGNGGFAIDGAFGFGTLGYSVSDAGDVNGDGLADLIVGASGASAGGPNSGAAYVVFGKADGTTVDIATVNAGVGGFAIDGASAGDFAGTSVSGAGDVNGDGLADLIVGAEGAGPIGAFSGMAYIVFGKADGTAVDLSDVESGQGGFAIDGASAGDFAGSRISGAGDVNGDGLADLIVGAYGAQTRAGEAYVVFGKSDGTTVELSDIRSGSGGFVIQGASAHDNLGIDVSDAGDVNGDGLADLIVATQGSDAVYVVYGKTSTSAVDISDVADGEGGFVINGVDNLAVSAAGDVNGDGADDLLVGSPDGVSSGTAYVVFGTVDTDLDNVLHGGLGDDERFGYLGDDALYGGAGEDSLHGGIGNDTLHGEADDDLLLGHVGADAFVFTGDGGNDMVGDFSSAQGDVIRVQIGINGTAIATTGDLVSQLSHDGSGNALLDLGAGNSVTLVGVDHTSLGTSQFALF